MKLAVLSTLYVLTLVALVVLSYRHEIALVAAVFPLALLLYALASTRE